MKYLYQLKDKVTVKTDVCVDEDPNDPRSAFFFKAVIIRVDKQDPRLPYKIEIHYPVVRRGKQYWIYAREIIGRWK